MATEKQRQRIVDALMALAGETDFHRIGLAEIARRADVTPAQLRQAYDGKIAILADFVRRIDAAVLAGDDPGMAGEPARERLFDVIMRRFDALRPYRAGLRGLARAVRRDPLLALTLNGLAVGSARWMLAAAGLDRGGPLGLARAQALALAYAQVLPVFVDDAEPGLAKTMAALDRALKRLDRAAGIAERVEAVCCRIAGHRERGRGAGESEAPAAAI